MDNGFVERAIRKFAIGRNKWMFSDTEAGAEASAMFYSLLCTAKINGGASGNYETITAAQIFKSGTTSGNRLAQSKEIRQSGCK